MIKLIEPPEVKSKRTVRDGDGWIIYCPGCKHYHKFRSGWSFNGNTENPTFNPSLVIKLMHEREVICHSFVRDGNIEFLSDCKHKLAGHIVKLPILDNNGKVLNMRDMPKKTIKMIEPVAAVTAPTLLEILESPAIPETIPETIHEATLETIQPEVIPENKTGTNKYEILVYIAVIGAIIFGVLALWK